MALSIKESFRRRKKGLKFEQRVSRIIRDIFQMFSFTKADVRAAEMGNNGEDIILSNRARKLLNNITIECKDHKNKYGGTYDVYEQAKGHNTNCEPVGIITDSFNKRPVLAVIGLEHYLKLQRELAVLKEQQTKKNISLNGSLKRNGFFVPISNRKEIVATVTVH